jgi:hypothetical protein
MELFGELKQCGNGEGLRTSVPSQRRVTPIIKKLPKK